MTRRDFLKFSSLAAAGGLITATTAALFNDESNTLSIEHITIPIPNLQPALEGFKIVQMSDIHLYPFTKLELVQRAVQVSNSLKPDITVLTGDYVWRNLSAINDLTPALAELDAKYGVFATMGNHDYWLNVEVIKDSFKSVGLPVLENQGVTFNVGGAHLHLAGLDDGWSGNPDLNAAMQGAPEGAPVVLLMHEPDLADIYSQDPRISLQLSGHTHGGQIRIPGIGALVHPHLGRKYDFGLYNVNGMWLYTNRGIGCISEPIRLNCPPEISEFTLARA
jgi:predicted MPP superfamily phosphohydrolase